MPRLIQLFLIAGLAFTCSDTLACSCIGKSEDFETTVRIALADNPFVFYAEATKVKKSRRLRWSPIGSEPIEHVEWRVLRSWKGGLHSGEVVESTTMTECCACGESVKTGDRLVFYLSSIHDFEVSSCSLWGRTMGKSLAEETQLLDRLVQQKAVLPIGDSAPRR